MDNYKIKVKDEAESKEAQELFFELGYSWSIHGKTFNKSVENGSYIFPQSNYFLQHGLGLSSTEITFPQLRDLVVLKRNDVKDKTHCDKRDESIYLTSDKVIYYWQGEWCKSAINKSNDYENYIANSLTPIAKPQAPALISGADALRALADGKGVDVHESTYKNEVWFNLKDTKFTPAEILAEKVRDKPYKLSFRLKPQTIKLELELPKPFEPEEDCHVYILDDGKTDGYRRYSYEVHGDKGNTFIGIWRTEEEIKQVVEQLRKIRGTNS